MAALLLWTAALFLALALGSFAGAPAGSAASPLDLFEPGRDWVGPVGAAFARGLVALVGVVAWAVPIELALLGIPFIQGRQSTIGPARVAGDVLLAVLISALVQVANPTRLAFGRYPASGLVGELFGEVARSLFSTVGSFLVGLACIGLLLIARASFSFIALVRLLSGLGTRSVEGTAAAARAISEAWRTARELEQREQAKAKAATTPHIALGPDGTALVAVLPDEDGTVELGAACAASRTADPGVVLLGPAPAQEVPGRTRRRRAPAATSSPPPAVARRATKKGERGDASAAEDPSGESDALRGDWTAVVEPASVPVAANDGLGARGGSRRRKEGSPTIVDTSAALRTQADDDESVEDPRGAGTVRVEVDDGSSESDGTALVAAESEEPESSPGDSGEGAPPAPRPRSRRAPKSSVAAASFRFPPLDFLVPARVDPSLEIDRDALLRNAELLVKTLSDYRISGKVEDILPGPTVTTYEVSPAAGTKVSRVAALADDLALALAKKVRIVAPIPGKNRIGFELPNERRVPVNLRDLIEDKRFRGLDVPLPVVLGRDILGNPVYADLASMPHVIVAGATGAGKSVGLNVMLTSLLYRRSPEELRLLMIDPKVVELAPFDRIPHMLLPVVTDMKQAATALKWAVDEMERRYQLFADAGTKNIGTYNTWVGKVRAGELQLKLPLARTVVAKDHNGLPEKIPAEAGEEGTVELPERLPFIVIVVDEFADLMMQQGKEVEAAVARLAQKARAAGMHVILATQRPSVDVITGMIKANFPTRVAFRVAQKVDSRTILDEQGAEHLLGAGDMLIKLNGTNETKRVQCPWVSEGEVQLVTDHLRAQGEPVYDENILRPREEDGEGGEGDQDGEVDAMYDDAVRVVAETRRCSTSWLQRKLGLGYNRAARIVETMERRGVVGPANGSKDREVLITAF